MSRYVPEKGKIFITLKVKTGILNWAVNYSLFLPTIKWNKINDPVHLPTTTESFITFVVSISLFTEFFLINLFSNVFSH